MSRLITQAARLLLAGTVAGVLGACGSGGFGGETAAAPPSNAIEQYVALGDGFTAAPYAGETIRDDGCLRSKDNYAALVAQKLGIKHVRDVSCTGATTAALTGEYEPDKGASPVPPQIDAVGKDTDLVTMGIGIEDHDLLHNMFDVCLTTPCRPGSTEAPDVVDQIDQIADSIRSAVQAVQDTAPLATIVLVGYPQIVPDTTRCDALPPLDETGLKTANYVLAVLNRHIESVARQTGAEYLDAAILTSAHALCSPEPWVTGSRGRPGRSVAYHPLAAEQRVVADQLAEQVRNH